MAGVFLGENVKEKENVDIECAEDETVGDESPVVCREDGCADPENDACKNGLCYTFRIEVNGNVFLCDNECDDRGQGGADRGGDGGAHEAVVSDEDVVEDSVGDRADDGEPHRESGVTDTVEGGTEEIENSEPAETEGENLQDRCGRGVFATEEQNGGRGGVGENEDEDRKEDDAGIAQGLRHESLHFFEVLLGIHLGESGKKEDGEGIEKIIRDASDGERGVVESGRDIVFEEGFDEVEIDGDEKLVEQHKKRDRPGVKEEFLVGKICCA